MTWILSIDFGTSYSMATIHDDSSSGVEIVDLNGARAVPSGVWLDDAGSLVVGAAAARQARLAPERWERAPKRFLGDPTPLLLGGRDVPVVDAVAEVLRLLAAEAIRRRGGLPEEVRLTYPARWGVQRQNALRVAAQLGGLGRPPLRGEPRLISEPVAAALYFAQQGQLSPGATVAVYDLGGGTFDTAVLRALPDGVFRVLSLGGIDGLGGELFDDLLYQHVGTRLSSQVPQAWARVIGPPDRQWARAGQALFQNVHEAKEDLSRYPSARIDTGPLVGVEDLELTRQDMEQLLRPKIEESAHELRETISRAELRPSDLQAVYLAGGSSRMPLISSVVTDVLGVECEVLGEPKSVVVVGAAQWRPNAVALPPSEQVTQAGVVPGGVVPPSGDAGPEGSFPHRDGVPTDPSLEPTRLADPSLEPTRSADPSLEPTRLADPSLEPTRLAEVSGPTNVPPQSYPTPPQTYPTPPQSYPTPPPSYPTPPQPYPTPSQPYPTPSQPYPTPSQWNYSQPAQPQQGYPYQQGYSYQGPPHPGASQPGYPPQGSGGYPVQAQPSRPNRRVAIALVSVLGLLVVGLAGALGANQLHRDPPSSPSPTSSSTVTASTTAPTTDTVDGSESSSSTVGDSTTQDQLIQSLPDGLVDRSSCDSMTDIASAIAGVSCSPASEGTGTNPPTEIQAYLFRSSADMMSDFNRRETSDSTGVCAKTGWHFGSDGQPTVGQQLCGRNKMNKAVMVWTYDTQYVEIYAFGENGDTGALHTWWKSAPGKLNCPAGSSGDVSCAS
jgi:hypothetical protein